mmetsp:Transcript_11183/g.33127  ORF Transcript_11183/g.33127 Transcript_11183/m.33127 type:complete len:104 (-) Transcript_11183:17-328(-)
MIGRRQAKRNTGEHLQHERASDSSKEEDTAVENRCAYSITSDEIARLDGATNEMLIEPEEVSDDTSSVEAVVQSECDPSSERSEDHLFISLATAVVACRSTTS